MGSRKGVVGQSNSQPRIVILSTFTAFSVNSAKDLGPHRLYSEILRLRLRMTPVGSFNLTHHPEGGCVRLEGQALERLSRASSVRTELEVLRTTYET